MLPAGSPQGDSSQNVKIPFIGATEVNHEPSASTPHVLGNSPMRRSYEACSSIKMPDLFMLKWHWRPPVVQLDRFLTPLRQPLPS